MTRTIPNPNRGCGYLEQGKAYVRGVTGSPNGTLPSFVECSPMVPFREHGSDGGFTRGYEQIAGVTTHAGLKELTRFNPRYPGDLTDADAKENMAAQGYYVNTDRIPDDEYTRHVNRADTVGAEHNDHYGEIPLVQQSDLLMRVGKTHYPDPEDYIEEAIAHGIRKAIPVGKNQEPPAVRRGVTRMWLVHPTADDGHWGVIGYAYLGEVVYTEPEDGHVPQWVQDYDAADRLNVVDIAEPETPNGNLHDYDESETNDDSDSVDIEDESGDKKPVEADIVSESPGSSDADTVVPAEDDSDRDTQSLYNALDDAFDFQTLRSVASRAAGVETQQNPAKADLLDALSDAGITPRMARNDLGVADD